MAEPEPDEDEDEDEDDDDDGAAAFYALDEEARGRFIGERLTALAGIFERFVVEADDTDRPELRGTLPGSARHYRVVTTLEHGEITVRADGDDAPLGYLDLRYVPSDDEPPPAGWLPLGDEVFLIEEELGGARDRLDRLPATLVQATPGWMSSRGVSRLELGEDVRAELYAFIWETGPDALGADRLRAILEHIGRLADAVAAGGEQVCAYCSARFLPDATRRCTHCGAPMPGA